MNDYSSISRDTTDNALALYQKMAAEQDVFRDWLTTQPAKEILDHAYEYIIREDILITMEYEDILSNDQINALLSLPTPLANIYHDFLKIETDHMECIRDCIVGYAEKQEKKHLETQKDKQRPSVLDKLQAMQKELQKPSKLSAEHKKDHSL